MSDVFCDTIHKSVTAFVSTTRGHSLAMRGLRGELEPGQFFSAACAASQPGVQERLTQSFTYLPHNLERALLQAWYLARQTDRQFDLDWRLAAEGPEPDLEVRYRLETQPERICFVVDAVAAEKAEATTT